MHVLTCFSRLCVAMRWVMEEIECAFRWEIFAMVSVEAIPAFKVQTVREAVEDSAENEVRCRCEVVEEAQV